VITFGAISHHYFAGYGGGRKLIFPGLGHKAAIYANHGLFLDQTLRRLSPGCRCGQLDGNPLAEDLAEVETFFPAHMAVHAILDSHGTVCDLLVGRGVADFRDACARHGRHCEVAGNTCDLVLASCGGYPKDINFIQAHKAIENSAAFVRDGGRLIVLAQCVDGIGSQTFLPWFALGNWGEAFDRLAADYEGNGGTALSMMAKLARIRIGVVTDIPQAVCDQIGFERLTLSQAQDEIAAFDGPVAVLPNAGMLVRKSGKAPSTP
jgi:nickel-dependent lactate racemase